MKVVIYKVFPLCNWWDLRGEKNEIREKHQEGNVMLRKATKVRCIRVGVVRGVIGLSGAHRPAPHACAPGGPTCFLQHVHQLSTLHAACLCPSPAQGRWGWSKAPATLGIQGHPGVALRMVPAPDWLCTLDLTCRVSLWAQSRPTSAPAYRAGLAPVLYALAPDQCSIHHPQPGTAHRVWGWSGVHTACGTHIRSWADPWAQSGLVPDPVWKAGLAHVPHTAHTPGRPHASLCGLQPPCYVSHARQTEPRPVPAWDPQVAPQALW